MTIAGALPAFMLRTGLWPLRLVFTNYLLKAEKST